MKKTLIAAAIIGFLVAPSAFAADAGMFASPAIASYARPAIEAADNKILRGVALVADTLSGAIALGEDAVAVDITGVDIMIGGADVLALSNPVSGIGAGSSGIEIACAAAGHSAHAKPEVGWRTIPSA